MDLPNFDTVVEAAQRLEGQAVRTPLVQSQALNERVGGRVLIKPEVLQRTGSFKFRGAFNALSQFTPDQRKTGVVAFSSGNHAQGIAEAARILGMPALIVMPEDAPEIKKAGVRSRGGEIRLYDRASQSREDIAAEIAGERGATLIPAYDHKDVIAGQGTSGLEVFNDLEALELKADQLVCCVGGGGLLAGINLAAESLSPETRIYGAEPAGFDDTKRSLASGRREINAKMAGSICDAIVTPQPGELTWAINGPRLSGVGICTDEEALKAVRFAFETLKLVVEPGGAAALACVLNGQIDVKDTTTVIMMTGGNVDREVFAKALSA